MENKKGLGIIGLVVICLTVSAIFGIAYATFNQSLTISGSSTVNASSWKIGWKSFSTVTGSVTVSNPPTINVDGSTATISGWSATLAKPGDYVEFDVTAKNYGSFDAKLTDIQQYGSPTSTSILSALTNGTQSSLVGTGKVVTCTGTNADSTQAATDAANVCNGLTFSITKEVSNSYANISSSNASLLTAGSGEETYRIKLLYSQDSNDTTGSTLPQAAVTVTVNQIDFIYTQQ